MKKTATAKRVAATRKSTETSPAKKGDHREVDDPGDGQEGYGLGVTGHHPDALHEEYERELAEQLRRPRKRWRRGRQMAIDSFPQRSPGDA